MLMQILQDYGDMKIIKTLFVLVVELICGNFCQFPSVVGVKTIDIDSSIRRSSDLRQSLDIASND